MAAENLSSILQRATQEKLRKFELIKGKHASTFPFAFWDIVVISAADEAQSFAFQQQINEKIERKLLPLGIKFFCFPDPGAAKIGPGGSLMAVMYMLNTFYGSALQNKKILFIPSGGFSQRLPSCSLLGKIFTTLPFGDPIYQMLELKLAMYIDLPAKMKSGLFLANTDTFILYDASSNSDWTFDRPGITAMGHPAPLSLGVGHGVFVIDSSGLQNTKVSIVECKQFLHKVKPEVMREKGAVLPNGFSQDFGSDDLILIDSCYYMDIPTAKKLMVFYASIQPLEHEIDSHGDFLQALGLDSNMDYIHNTQNVVDKGTGLVKMREQIYEALRGTKLSTLVLHDSKFYHVGTTAEYLHHFTSDTVLKKELGLTCNACNKYYVGTEVAPRKLDESENLKFNNQCCIMNSILPFDTEFEGRCVMEFCHFNGSFRMGEDVIISNCCFIAPSEEEISIPSNIFLHTACIMHNGTRSYVTVAFNNDDNLKRKVALSEANNLYYLGKPIIVFCKIVNLEEADLFSSKGDCCLWNAKLFQPKATMQESFLSALDMISAVREGVPLGADYDHNRNFVSMADILHKKDVDGMLMFRRELSN